MKMGTIRMKRVAILFALLPLLASAATITVNSPRDNATPLMGVVHCARPSPT